MLFFKENLPVDTLDMRPIELPAKTAEEAAQLVLHVGMQYDLPRMWYQADADVEKKVFTILAIGTGHPWGNEISKESYIGTLPFMGGTLILHYFLVEGDLIRNFAERLEQKLEGF